MLRYLLPSVAIVAACVAVYATSLRAPPPKDQLTLVPVVFDALRPPPAQLARPAVPASPPEPAPTQPEPPKPATLPAQTPPPLSSQPIARAPVVGHRRPNRQLSNRGPPSIHELLQSVQAALAGNDAPLIRRLQEFATPIGNRLRFAMCRDLRCNPHRDLASHTRRNQFGHWSYWPAYWSYWPTWPRLSHDRFKHRKDDDYDDD